jgi:hypothetical protein
MNRTFILVVIIGLLAACGNDQLEKETGKVLGKKQDSDYSEECIKKIPEDVAKEHAQLYKKNEDSRKAALAAKQAELNLAPLKVSTVLSNVDPFVDSMAIELSPQKSEDQIIGRYNMFHGWEGAQTFYETAPGSNSYFIVDEVLLGTTNESLHSWHSSADNGLARAVFKPIDSKMAKLTVCGCGPNASEVRKDHHHDKQGGRAIASDVAVAAPAHAIFKLPGSAPATLLKVNFDVEYKTRSVDIKYVPKRGHTCVADQWAC